MLDTQELRHALTDAERDAQVCTLYCRAGSEIKDGNYNLWHNGTGPSTTSEQRVHDSTVLSLPSAALTIRLTEWLKACHRQARFDVNTGREVGA
jgi:hypothetical protein